MKWFSKGIDYLRKLFYNEYELTVWFTEEEIYDAGGNLMTARKSPKIFRLTSVNKLTQKHVIGKEKGGGKLVIKTQKPFDYNLRKIH